MLTKQQKYGIASQLCFGSLENFKKKRTQMMEVFTKEEITELFSFAEKIDPMFKKRDGFIPKAVLKMIG